ncbi:MAG: hypothetical protein PWP28_2040 [Oceanotoga sp.]|jgi:AraC-like DNA-binding protein|uniref:AraC-like DNA-binding protein n=1 Tax=Oceanotoga teriensis TaxID=515440 RepID=A0AA45C4Q7_9BACT|nr:MULTISPECIES: AraC family transcriptional regulator [Oceanotoga]MDN5343165.1 hypothetical protein [Oceanotoga sp.]PWJ87132.1 AraC-like DNA-binding protein [Oceanotoga teriensis]
MINDKIKKICEYTFYMTDCDTYIFEEKTQIVLLYDGFKYKSIINSNIIKILKNTDRYLSIKKIKNKIYLIGYFKYYESYIIVKIDERDNHNLNKSVLYYSIFLKNLIENNHNIIEKIYENTLLNYNFDNEYNEIEETIETETEKYFFNMEDKIFNNFKNKKFDEVKEDLSFLIESIENLNYNKNEFRLIKNLYIILISDLIDIAIDIFNEKKLFYDLLYKYMIKIESIKNMTILKLNAISFIEDIKQIQIHHSTKKYSLKVKKIIKYIEKNLNKNIKLEEISLNIGISKSHMCKIFKKEMNKTINDYIIDRKIEKAKNLLKYTDLNIKNIYSEIGFNDQSYFSFIFKKKVGVTPIQYKNSNHII